MITISKVSKWYGKIQVLKNCTADVAKGEVVVVCGPSGSGKSTLIKCVNALEPFQEGTITVEGISVGDPKTNLSKLRARIGMVFQHFELFPHVSVIRNLTLAQIKVLGRDAKAAEEKGMKLLERVGLSAHAQKYPGQLSGGQQQRVAIARALINEPSMILADEPTGNLDTRTSIEVMGIFQRLNKERGITVLLITHEMDIAEYGTRLIRFRDGRIVADQAVLHRRNAADELAALPPPEPDQIPPPAETAAKAAH